MHKLYIYDSSIVHFDVRLGAFSSYSVDIGRTLIFWRLKYFSRIQKYTASGDARMYIFLLNLAFCASLFSENLCGKLRIFKMSLWKSV